MVELRRDAVVERWITIPRERGIDIEALFPGTGVPSHDPCPFCPGASSEKEIFAIRDGQGKWRTRVLPDIRPILKIEGKMDRQAKGIYDRMNGIGAHEIVVESPEHEVTWATMEPDQLAIVLRTWRERSLDLRKDTRIRAIFIAKNHGGMASHFQHPHSHVVGLPIVPRAIVEEIEGAENYFEYKERCVWCDIREQEKDDPSRTLSLDEHFLVIAPYASRFPFELMILPLVHQSDFASTADDALMTLAKCLRSTFEIVQRRLHDASYSLIVHSAPVRNPPDYAYHWHIEVRPRMAALAGFEWGTGFFTNPIPPEIAIAHLKA